MTSDSLPLPLDPPPPPEADDKRLWVGNLDSRLTEYHLIKLFQQYGKVRKFDFLFHKSGPLKGQPRGYCFVTYEERNQAESALSALNGKQVLKKVLSVKWAHTVPTEEVFIRNPLKQGLVLDEPKANKSVHSQISAIEAKLKAMEEQQDKDLEQCLSAKPMSENSVWQPSKKPETKPQRTRETIVPYYRPQRRTQHSRYPRRR